MPHRFVIAALLAAAPAAAGAQERDLDREPSLGKIVAGEAPAGGPARFLLTLQPGQAVELTAAPVAGSDPAMRVYDAAGGALIASNDDALGLAAHVRLYSAARQRVRIEVADAALDGGAEAIRFDLILRPSEWRPRPPVALTLGATHEGELSRDDEQLFRLRGQAGQVWDLTLAAAPGSGLDPALDIFAGDVAGGNPLESDDDGAGGLDSRLRFQVPADGTYTLRARPVGSSAGAYVLATAASASPAAELREVGLAAPAAGTLAGGDEHLYRLDAAARAALTGTLVIDLRRAGPGGPDALDPVLEVGFDTPLGFTELRSDDDGGEDGNARLTLAAAELTGPWLEALRIKATGFLETAGDYELTVSAAP